MHRIILFLVAPLFLVSLVNAAEPEPKTTPIYETEFVDPEQQQLEWCFIYSNRLGYQIEYIANPRLFEQVSKWIGTKYQFAGNDEAGIDCSGFICHMYREVYGQQLNGSSKDIYKEVKSVRRDELREGDLVFFKINPSRISHVGIYLGNNKFAHASVHNGVIVSDLDEPYYAKRYYDSGRPSEN